MVSGGIFKFGDKNYSLSGIFRVGGFLSVVLALMLVATPAYAKKKKRPAYSPPQASMVIDAYTGKILHAHNIDAKRFPASITKVMTLYIVFEMLKSKELTLDTPLKVSAFAASRPPSKLGLKEGSEISVRDAMYALVTKSANDVATIVAENIAGSESAFAALMTNKARSIGMNNTIFRNASGLPNETQKSTARDLITLGRRILMDYPEYSKIFRTRYFTYGKTKFRNHNRLLFDYAGSEGIKTGFTRASGFNLLTSAKRDDKHLIAVVIGGSSGGRRNATMRSLLDKAWGDAIALNTLKQNGHTITIAADSDSMPVRNPAFHPGAAENAMAAQAQAQAQNQTHQAAQKGDALVQQPQESRLTVAATLASGPSLRQKPENIAVRPSAETEEGDTEVESVGAGTDPADSLGPYHVQVGSYLDQAAARTRLEIVSAKAGKLVSGHGEMTVAGAVNGKSYYRARFGQFEQAEAAQTCSQLKKMRIDCLVIRAD